MAGWSASWKSSIVTATRGRALDHIGFEVRNLEAFVKKLEAQGITPQRGTNCEASLFVEALKDSAQG